QPRIAHARPRGLPVVRWGAGTAGVANPGAIHAAALYPAALHAATVYAAAVHPAALHPAVESIGSGEQQLDFLSCAALHARSVGTLTVAGQRPDRKRRGAAGRRRATHTDPAAGATRAARLSGATGGPGPDLHAPCVPNLGQ